MGQNERVKRIVVPGDVESLLKELEELIGPHGQVDWRRATRVSVHGTKGRYLKYEPQPNRWVFCAAVGERMDVIDPQRVCVRGATGTRGRNAAGRYTGDAGRMRPLLQRLAHVIIDDSTGVAGFAADVVAGETMEAEEQTASAPARKSVREAVFPESAVMRSQGGEAALSSFLADIFDGDAAGLRRWVRLSLGKEIHDELPDGSANLSQLVFEATLAIQRHGRADAALFVSLHELRPQWADRIWGLARLYGVERQMPEHADPSRSGNTASAPLTLISANTRAASDPLDPLAMRLEDALKRKQKLEAAGLSTGAVLAEIRALKREHRRGGQLRPGDALGDRYLLAEQIGRGGFATVWRARDSLSGNEVAIKVLHPELAGDSIRRQRFFRGARIMAELAHPLVVNIREREVEDDGFFYFVMDFVAGGNLQDAVIEQRVKREHAVPIILSVGEALAEAHRRGHVHRDVKPVNILLTASGAPRLTDFDLVTGQDTTGGTRTGALGTFIYAAPEMMERPQDADARADVYGLGMTMAFVLHGDRLPRRALTARERFIEELGCPPTLKTVLKRATAEDAEDRYSDAAAFCEALRATESLGSFPVASNLRKDAPERTTSGVTATEAMEAPFVEPVTGIRFLWVPGGRFWMGSGADEEDAFAYEKPRHWVEVSGYWLAETPVTNRQYEVFLRERPGSRESRWRKDRKYNQPEQPVVGVSWLEAREFCQWLSERSAKRMELPTEAQWERAARGDDGRKYPWGGNEPDPTRAHYGKGLHDAPIAVGSLPAGRGPYGHLELAGNVWEWCRDVWDGRAYEKRGEMSVDPEEPNADDDPEVARACRGGAFGYEPRYLRSAFRDRYLADDARHVLGFRVAALPTSR